MAYDKSITVFSPDGHLFQLEYANNAITKGGTVLSAKTAENIYLMLEEDSAVSSLVESSNISTCGNKIVRVCDGVFATYTGLAADGSVMVRKLQLAAQQLLLYNDSPPTVKELAQVAAEKMQQATQKGGTRPFGVSILLFGVDRKENKQISNGENTRLFEIKPSGVYLEWNAVAIGKNQNLYIKAMETEVSNKKPNYSLEFLQKTSNSLGNGENNGTPYINWKTFVFNRDNKTIKEYTE